MFGKIFKKKKKKKDEKEQEKPSKTKQPTTNQSASSTSKPVVQSTASKATSYDASIVQQLIQFGYQRTEILAAIETVTNKSDINEIQAFIDASNDKVITEMKSNKTPKNQQDIGISDITKQCKMVYDSGTYQGYPWNNVYTPDTSYWCSKDTNNCWIVVDTGKSGKIYVLFLQYAASYNASSINISTAHAFDAEESEWTLLNKVNTKEVEKRHAVAFGKNPNHKQYIKIQFVGNSTYIGIQAFEAYGQFGSGAATMSDGAVKAPTAFKNITAGIPCVGSSKTYDGYPISNMYTADANYWCSVNASNVYLIFDTGTTKISQWQMTMGYNCGKVAFLTSDNKDTSNWTKMKAGTPESKINLNKKNQRYIKLAFSDVTSGYVGITTLRIMIPVKDKSPEGMEDEKKEDVAMSADSKNISKSLFITAVGDSGTYSGYDIKQAYRDDDSYWCSASSGDQWVVFDVNVCSIDVLEVLQQSSYCTKNISAWTTHKYDKQSKSAWIKVASCTATPGVKASLKIKGNNERYIKLLLEKTTSYGSLQRIKWFGSVKADNDITNKVSILKTSSAKTGNEIENIFKDSDNYL